jgi:lipopolysaccharide/colanic/teichoic acid biosynthesis glycosyltransferase
MSLARLVPSVKPQGIVGADTLPVRFPAAARDGTLERPAAARIKRTVDVALVSVLLALTAPVLLLAMLLIKLTSPGPAIFRQPRIGYRCRTFDMFKLRTMVVGAEKLQDDLAEAATGRTFLKIKDDPRTTLIGRVLRRLSIDELPQLHNVLRGEMSLVGPRPLLPCDFEKFPRHEQMQRFAVRPGITGLWQVMGRSRCTDKERIRLDLEYVRRHSLWLDLEILLRTVPVALSGDGAY